MKLSWLDNGFICRELYAPFVLDKDSEYLPDLKKKYEIIIRQATRAGADVQSLWILNKYKNKILEALNCYYHADIAKYSSSAAEKGILPRHLPQRIYCICPKVFAQSRATTGLAFREIPASI